MEKLRFYIDLDNNFLLAHERSTEFFVRYIPSLNEWEECIISFSNFVHDYYFKEITREEAIQKTNGRLPDIELKSYLNKIRG